MIIGDLLKISVRFHSLALETYFERLIFGDLHGKLWPSNNEDKVHDISLHENE